MVAKKCSPGDGKKDAKKYQPKLPKSERNISCRKRQKIIRQGDKSHWQTILMAAAPQSRWQMAIYLQKIKGACRRNQIKRKIRAAYQTAKPRFQRPYAMVFTVIGDPGPVDVHALRQHLIKTYQQEATD